MRQIATESRMYDVNDLIKIHLQEHGEYPTTLAQVWPRPPGSKFHSRHSTLGDYLTCDGWGRPLVYFASADGFFLASFGRNGVPEPQVGTSERVILDSHVEPWALSVSQFRETDIVIIDGEWVQAPFHG